MKLVELKLKNFRSYRDERTIVFDDLTVLIGKNDAGKSSLLDALNIFFNDASIEKEDASVDGDSSNVCITCVFGDLPEEIILDEQFPTSLQREYLVRADGMLEICRVFNCSTAKPKQSKVFARAMHPSAIGCSDLLGLKIVDLKARATQRTVDLTGVNQTVKTLIRRAIWRQNGDPEVALKDVELESEAGKIAWSQIQTHLPVFALFKSDRASTDQDEEAQDPMKAAIKEAVKAHETQLNGLIDQVKLELENVARRTVEKIQEMSPQLANTLSPQVKNKNWDSLFTVTLTGDNGISINKRGSGTRRLVLLNFFRAKAEEVSESKGSGTIYAIEEPETSQHPNHQMMLLDAFGDLTTNDRCQVILTTHTPTLARKIDRKFLRYISSDQGHPEIQHGDNDATLEAIKNTLGVLPDHDVKVFVGVEGKWDIEFLRRASKILSDSDPSVPDLAAEEAKGSLVFIPLGGSSLELWSLTLAGLQRPEFYFTDRDNAPPAQPKYQSQLAIWNARPNCRAVCTTKRELENYIHPDVIKLIAPLFPNTIRDFDDVPLMLAEALHTGDSAAPAWNTIGSKKQKEKSSRAKKRLNTECVSSMTSAHFTHSDPNSEIKSWLNSLGTPLNH